MPIVAQNDHPSLQRVAGEGIDVITSATAEHQDIRELHIGFLNMMPDAAFLATERQFFRLTASSTNIVQIYLHPIRCEGMQRTPDISRHIQRYYYDFDHVADKGLDALIVTGANPQFSDLTQEPYWACATKIFDWAENNVASVFFSCLASHAVLQAQYQLKRTPLPTKKWGIYSHRVLDRKHPLVANINTRFDMPHSRGNEVSEADFLRKNLRVLAGSADAGVALATSQDGFKQVFCQGHPEYDTASILKEYKREINHFLNRQREHYPPLPDNYLTNEQQRLLNDFAEQLRHRQTTFDDFPDEQLLSQLDNTWRDTAKAIFSNWIGLVYRVTHVDRTQQFMDGIDPNAPIARWYSEIR